MAEDERDLDAAERALGTLNRDGEGPAEVRLRETWERRLAPLADAVAPVAPPEGLFDRVMLRIDGELELGAARRRGRTWQAVAALAGAVAAAALLWIAYPYVQGETAPRLAAVVASDAGGPPGMVVQIDFRTRGATVIPLVEAPPGTSLQMWQLPVGAERPQSLGLLPDAPVTLQTVTGDPGDLFAISLEPPGGSPTGQPTDARYHGKLLRVE